MLRVTSIACVIVGLIAVMPGGATAATTSRAASGACAGTGSMAVDEATRQQAVRAMRCLVNAERAAAGAYPLRSSNPLVSAALGHSAAMVSGKFISHSSLNGDTVRKRVRRTSYARRSRNWVVGETLTWGSGMFATPAELVAALMASPPHRATMLDRRFRDVGIGMVLGAPILDITGAAATVTLNFGRR